MILARNYQLARGLISYLQTIPDLVGHVHTDVWDSQSQVAKIAGAAKKSKGYLTVSLRPTETHYQEQGQVIVGRQMAQLIVTGMVTPNATTLPANIPSSDALLHSLMETAVKAIKAWDQGRAEYYTEIYLSNMMMADLSQLSSLSNVQGMAVIVAIPYDL